MLFICLVSVNYGNLSWRFRHILIDVSTYNANMICEKYSSKYRSVLKSNQCFELNQISLNSEGKFYVSLSKIQWAFENFCFVNNFKLSEKYLWMNAKYRWIHRFRLRCIKITLTSKFPQISSQIDLVAREKKKEMKWLIGLKSWQFKKKKTNKIEICTRPSRDASNLSKNQTIFGLIAVSCKFLATADQNLVRTKNRKTKSMLKNKSMTFTIFEKGKEKNKIGTMDCGRCVCVYQVWCVCKQSSCK